MKNSCAWDFGGHIQNVTWLLPTAVATLQVPNIVPDMSYKEPLLLHGIGWVGKCQWA